MPRLDAFGIAVADMAAALAFYRLIGLDIPLEADQEGHVDVDLGGGMRMMFDTHEVIHSFDPEWTAPGPARGFGLAFRCDSPPEVDRIHDEMVAAGHRSKMAPFDAFWGQRYATLFDPDGNPVDLYAALT